MNTSLFEQPSALSSVKVYVDVILPVPIPKLYTYQLGMEWKDQIGVGFRVIVPFGKKKILTGIVGKIHKEAPQAYHPKMVLEVLDEEAVVSKQQLQLLHWAANYYLCPIGEVLNAALPSGLKLSSQSRIQLHPEFQLETSQNTFSFKEIRLLAALKHNDTLSYPDVEKILEQKNFYHVLNSLIKKEAILIFEEIKEKYKPKVVKKIRLKEQFAINREQLQELFGTLEKKPKQLDVLLHYLQRVNVLQDPTCNNSGLSRKELVDSGVSTSSLNTLVNNGIMEAYEEIVSRFGSIPFSSEQKIVLNEAQEHAKQNIYNQFEQKDTVLLHGITGSGKTEIYIQMIQEAIESGSQVLYLLPEIALTTQIVGRLQKVFGDKMGIYHSRFSDNERVEVWKGVLSGEFPLVVGVRSSVFLPFNNLGLVIIDEEHETSYKQQEPSPRYHARDLALMLAYFHHAKSLLGSATPSIESYYNARSGKYGLVTIDQRYGGAELPELKTTDILQERKRKTLQGDFSSELVSLISETLKKGEKAIIFQNRRGYAPYLSCEDCSWIPECQSCAVSLTYHLYSHELKCHYCGHKEKPPVTCLACGSSKLKMVGFGTEKIEEDLHSLFPEAKVQRMDLDTTRRKYGYQQIIDDFSKGNIDILVGTQMISKGLDFDKVSLVGIVDADRIINFPDFRAHERAFQMITQVSGRAGRGNTGGKVVIQSAKIDQPILQKVLQQDYFGLYREEIKERNQYKYPPFVRLIKISIRHFDQNVCEKAGRVLANILKEDLGHNRVMGPTEPFIAKIRNQYRREILIKLEKGINLAKGKEKIQKAREEILQDKNLKGISVIIDVDPF
ncbi:replication restart helicase PriA [Xanthovirga aplysinae]|uniref:replication restart helicase PriA n=1 Tax=Xanthovirga aplysinae TaxID=2529853 RepID=UPI0012BD049A|nr:primosomal protein N' [Xanthovirga aplysinae]MTI32361.1 primosomal protein N' [Xanthovirga aplysinae]